MRLAVAPKIKVAIITMFQPARGTPGELSHFRRHLRLRPWPVPGLPAGTSWRNDEGVAALVAGVGPVNTAVNVLSWALQSGVDWRQAHWLICGIAGGNPQFCSLGSAIWAEWVVDGDLAHDFHPADHPADWSTGILPLGAARPFARPGNSAALFGQPAQVFRLNAKLARQAQNLSRGVALQDSAALAKARAAYGDFTAGAGKPAVARGAVLSAARFWHGAHHHAWAGQWVRFWTRGRGQFFASSMEDSGTLGALRQLARLGVADWRRILLLRSISNYTLPPTGPHVPERRTAATKPLLTANDAGVEAALENGWRCAKPVIAALLAGASR